MKILSFNNLLSFQKRFWLKLRFIAAITLIALISNCQSAGTLKRTETANSYIFVNDVFGDFYFNDGNAVVKANRTGKEIARFSQANLGEITSIDPFNPMKIIVFYSDFDQIVFLDRNLVPLGNPVNLRELRIGEALCVAASPKDGFWVYDQAYNQLSHFDSNLKLSNQSGPLQRQAGSFSQPDFIQIEKQEIYLHFPGSGMLVCDEFGAFRKMIALSNFKPLQVIENGILGITNNRLVLYNFTLNKELVLLVTNEKLPATARISDNKIYYIQKGNKEISSFPFEVFE
jgi:hypothetical protein